jgi:MFS family permease
VSTRPLPPPMVLQRRTMRVLVVAQVLGSVGLAAGGTAGGLLAQHITGNAAAAGLPLAVLVLGAGISAVAVTRIMDRAGRRVGLSLAHLGGALGASVAVTAAALETWPLLLAGCVLLGAGTTAVMLARYAAADLASRRGRSISTVLAAATVGAVAGPNLLGPAGSVAQSLGLPEAAGLFLLAIPAFLGAALVLVAFLRPDPLQVARAAALARQPVTDTEQPVRTRHTGTPAAVLGNGQLRRAVLLLALINLTMVGMMAVAPVHLHAHRVGMGLVGLMVSAHIAAMFLPSPVAGRLADTRGGGTVAGAGALLQLGAGGAALMAGSSRAGIMAALLLLGIGWNAGLIGGSALLRDAPVQPSQRVHAEGFGELGMGAAAAAGGGGAGYLLATGGYGLIGLAAVAPCLLVLAVVATAAMTARGGRGQVSVVSRRRHTTGSVETLPTVSGLPHRSGWRSGRRLGRDQAGINANEEARP